MSTRPIAPAAPACFDAWPFGSWRTDVVRRAEFVVEGEPGGPTFGEPGNVQSAARPGQVPAEAAAYCDVAVGLLFSGEGHRLLVAADWAPMDMVVTDDAGMIDAFLEPCELVDVATYARRIVSQ